MMLVSMDPEATRRRFPVFLVDATDGITPETGEAGGQPQISINGGAFANTTATLVAVGNGAYYVELTQYGELLLSGHITVRYKSANTAEFNLTADVFLTDFYTYSTLLVDVRQWAGTNVATPTVLGIPKVEIANWLGTVPNALVSGRVDASVGAMAANVITAAATAVDFSTEVNTAVLAVLGALTDAAGTGDPTTSRTLAAYLKQIVNTLEGTAGMPTWPAAQSPGNAVSLAEGLRQMYLMMGTQGTQITTIQADADDIQTRLPAALVGGRMDASVGAMAANTVTAAALDPTAGAEIADAVWDEALVGHLTAGSTGAALNGAGSAGDPWTTPLPGAYGAGTAGNIVGNLDDGVAALQADTDNIQTRLPAALVGGRMDSSVGAMAANVMTGAAADPTLANEIADQVWDEVLAGHLTAGTTGAALNGAGAVGDPWGTAVPGAYASGSAGYILGTNLNATVSSRAAPADVPTAIQNADALLGRNLASVAGAAARSPLNALRFLRNKWSVAAGTLTVTQEDDTTVAWTAAVTSDSSAAPVTGSDPA